jgi:hypothetical protein
MTKEYAYKIWCIFASIENENLTPTEQQEKIEELLNQFKNEVSAQAKRTQLDEMMKLFKEKYL